METRNFLKGLSSVHVLIGKYVLAAVLLVVFIVGTCSYVSGLKSKLSAREREHDEFTRMMTRYNQGLGEIGPLKKRLRAASRTGSPVTAMEEIATRLGIKDKLRSFKGAEESLGDGYVSESVEVSIKDITLNQLVNLIYEIDRYEGLLLVKELDLETGFEDNKSLDCSLKVLLIQRAAS